MAGQGRSVEQWNALAPSTRRRWVAAFGGTDAALEAYRNGASLTKSQRGHRNTPERPINALLEPWKFPKYVATHTPQLNELARQRGLREHGTGETGAKVTNLKRAGGAYTWVITPEELERRAGRWHGSTSFRTEREAQLEARRVAAPAGVVLIVDWGPDRTFRYQLWFGYPEPVEGKKKKKKRRQVVLGGVG